MIRHEVVLFVFGAMVLLAFGMWQSVVIAVGILALCNVVRDVTTRLTD